MDPNNRVVGHKYYTINGIGALTPYYLSPWTLRVRVQGVGFVALFGGLEAALCL